jgi:two-component system, OmpR family, sensor kinase
MHCGLIVCRRPATRAKRMADRVESFQNVQVIFNEMDLLILVKNLVDNVILYTPPLRRVDLSVERVQETFF